MIDKLRIVKQRFDEVSDLIIQPDIITDQKRYVQLNKEYKELKEIVDKNGGFIPLPMIKNKKTVDPKDDSSPKVADF